MLTAGQGDVWHGHTALHPRHEADITGIASNPEKTPSGRIVRQPGLRRCARRRQAASVVPRKEGLPRC
jgi:hypothetical protein